MSIYVLREAKEVGKVAEDRRCDEENAVLEKGNSISESSTPPPESVKSLGSLESFVV
jgi:hypothetical protein